MKVTPETVVLIDCNCNEIQKIARAVRSAKVYTMIMPCSVPLERLQAEKPVGIIFCADKNEPELAAKAAGIAALDGIADHFACGILAHEHIGIGRRFDLSHSFRHHSKRCRALFFDFHDRDRP